MYALILIGLTVWGGGTPGEQLSHPQMMIVGSYSSQQACKSALVDFDKGKANLWSDETIGNYKMGELFRWGLLCAPAGDQKK